MLEPVRARSDPAGVFPRNIQIFPPQKFSARISGDCERASPRATHRAVCGGPENYRFSHPFHLNLSPRVTEWLTPKHTGCLGEILFSLVSFVVISWLGQKCDLAQLCHRGGENEGRIKHHLPQVKEFRQ